MVLRYLCDGVAVRHIEWLDLTSCGIEDMMLMYLCEGVAARHIEWFDLTSCGIRRHGVKVFM